MAEETKGVAEAVNSPAQPVQPSVKAEQKVSLGQLVQAEMAKRASACFTEVRQVLAKHNCDIQTTVFLTSDGRIQAKADVVANIGA